MDLPEGFSETPPQAAAPSALPEGFSEAPPVADASQTPPGFFAAPPPSGFSYDNPSAPQKIDPPDEQKTNPEVPGFWNAVGTSFKKGVVDRTMADIGGVQTMLPEAWGGKSLEQQFQEGQIAPETQDEITKLLGQKVSQGWSDPKWWGAQIAHGTGGMVPGLATAAAGSAIRIPALAGFTAEGGIGALVPAYKAARAAGLDPDAAAKQALIDSGISAATAAAMMVAPGFSLFGKIANPAVTDQVAEMLKRPVLETLAQLGLVQPTLGTAGEAIKTLSHGETPGADDLLTDFVTNVGVGAVPVGAHLAMKAVPKAASVLPGAPPATPEQVQSSFENQQPKATVVSTPEEAFDTTLFPAKEAPNPVFYSPTYKAAVERLPNSATPEQVIATLQNSPGVKEEELLDLDLPGYLKNNDGKVDKNDLLAHIESNGLTLEERSAGGPNEMTDRAKFLAEEENGPGSWDRIGGGGQEHYINDARREIQRTHVGFLHNLEEQYGFDQGKWPQEARDRLKLSRDTIEAKINPPQTEYPRQILPGEHSNYREFVLKVPSRGEEAKNLPREKQISGNIDPQENYFGSHWEDPNVIAHIRATDRNDRDGRRLLHVEEIQSDLHQAGRKQGYRDPNIPSSDKAHRALSAKNAEFDDFMQFNGQSEGETPAQTKTRLDAMPEYQKLMAERRPVYDAYQEALRNERAVPDLPFKTTWPELAVKRILRLAADEGYDGISWTNGDQVGLRQVTSKQLAGSREFYDKMVPKLFVKWAKKLGADFGTTKLEGVNTADLNPLHEMRIQQMGLDPRAMNDRNGFIQVSPAFSERVRMGLPLYDKDVTPLVGNKTLSDHLPRGTPKQLMGAASKIDKTIRSVANELKITRGMEFRIKNDPNERFRGRLDPQLNPSTGNYVIDVNLHWIRTPEDLYASMSHEFGHVIEHNLLETAPGREKALVWDAFDKFRAALPPGDNLVGDIRRTRDNAISEISGARNLHDKYRLSELTLKSQNYLLHRSEWFAEQVAKWMQTDERPMGKLESFFKSVAKKIKKMLNTFQQIRGQSPKAEKVVSDFLNSRYDNPVDWTGAIKEQFDLDTTRANQDAMERDGTPESPAVSQTASTGGGRAILGQLPLGGKSDGPAMAAHADRMNKFYEWMTSLPQIASMNKHIRGLQIYKEVVSLMNLEKNNIMGDAWSTLRQWKAIRDPKQLFGLNKFIEDYANGFFKLVDDGLVRRPTAPEFQALAAKHKLSAQSLRMFDKLVQDFDGFLGQYRGLLLAEAARIKDPTAQLLAVQAANKRIDDTLQKPFFPLTRFGKYTVTVYDHAGNVKHFEQTDSLRQQSQIAKALEAHTNFLPGDRVRTGEVPKDATPLLGMPPGLIDLVADKLNLSSTQRGMLDQLRFDYAPSQSFRHQFRSKDVTPGYSTDFQRAYAHFFFHGANHLTRVKWVDALRDQIRSVKSESILLNDANKRDKIANYMTEHLNMLVDPKPDFAALRGLMFHWFLGFNPASATLNLSQTAIMTHPHLASKFGDLSSLAAISRAGTELNNFYKKGTVQELGKTASAGPEGAKFRALAEAVKEGVISETQAHTLAAVSEDRNLLRAFGSKGEEAWQRFSEASSWMFEMTEQYNRRVAFRAAWELGMKDANNRYVSDTVRDNPLQYKRLRDQGWSHQEAAAFTAAKDSVEKTQFVYAPYARPKFMWGKKGALFIFKSFTQNTLFNLWHNPSMGARSLLIMGALGGMMGLPGTEDVNGILKAIAWRLFGKDFDLEDEARKFAVDVLHGNINPDLLLHGMSVHGFGIPHVLNSVGAHVGLPEKWFPTLDRSRSIGMGNILPIEPGKLFGPTKDAKGPELQQIQRASGAGFGNAFALYNFLTSEQDISSLKRWEGIMPKAFSNVSHAFRFLTQGKETNRSGNTVVKFDVNDTEQMAEILARAAGYNPRRLSAKYEKMEAQTEAATYWDLRKGILLRQFGEAVKGGNSEEKSRVLGAIRAYNQELPDEWKPKGISSATLKESVQNRLRVQAKTEAGVPLAKQNTLGFRSMEKYFPDGRPTGQTDAKAVK